MVGTIKQQLYVKGLPEGMLMRVTKLNLLPPDPPKEWRATLYTASGVERKAPFIVDPKVSNGHMGEVKMYGAHAFPSNSLGARLEILWELISSSTREAKEHMENMEDMDQSEPEVSLEHPEMKTTPGPAEGEEPPTVDPNDPNSWVTKLSDYAMAPRADVPARTGRFIVETTKWGLVQRPDYVSVVYQIGSATPLRVVSSVAATIIDMPSDALFVIGLNSQTQQIGINGVQDKAVADTLVSHLIKGIFYVHEKAFGWVFGKFW